MKAHGRTAVGFFVAVCGGEQRIVSYLFEVRLADPGLQHLAVLARIRVHLRLSPKQCKALLEKCPFTVAQNLSETKASHLVSSLRVLGAAATMQKCSCGCSDGVDHY
jgi:ribosomal protein L7/L12